jgi:dienelactone hydrolase
MDTHVIPTHDHHPVVADLYLPPGASSAPVAILCHGFKGHRRWGFIPYLARRLADAGIAAIAMDFSHNGHVPEDAGNRGVPDSGLFCSPGLFRLNTLARERADLEAVLAWLRGAGGGPPPASPVGLWGHSRGGVAAVLAALGDPSVAALVTWSTAAHPDFYTERQKQRWRRDRAYDFTDAATGTPLALGLDYLADLEAHRADYDLAVRAGALGAAHLIVHGEHDMVIPIEDAVRLHDAPGASRDRRRDKRLLRVVTGHTFGYDGGSPGDALERAVAATVEWFTRYLAGDNERGSE